MATLVFSDSDFDSDDEGIMAITNMMTKTNQWRIFGFLFFLRFPDLASRFRHIALDFNEAETIAEQCGPRARVQFIAPMRVNFCCDRVICLLLELFWPGCSRNLGSYLAAHH